MKLPAIDQLVVTYAPAPSRRARVGRLARKDREILFEYDPAFLATRLELSPFNLPLRPGVFVGPPAPFEGLMGLFDDSLPDGWGRLLIDRRAAQLGRPATPLDRLALVGARSMGALAYEPEVALDEPVILRLAELAAETEMVLRGKGASSLERLIAVGGSPKGARPKALIQLAPDGTVHFGARTIEPGFTSWLVKFPAPRDPPYGAALEHAYFLMARAAGLDVPRTQLLGRTSRRPGYFAIERFDRAADTRIHMQTLGGLLDLPLAYPALEYAQLLGVTRRLTRDESAVAEMFRRACFNVFAHNRDDHSRNFAFLMTERGSWRPSPAYDLTYSLGPGGEHTMLIEGEGGSPDRSHLLGLARTVGLRRPTAIIDEVEAAIGRFEQFADEAGVPARGRTSVAAGLRRRRSPAGSGRNRRPTLNKRGARPS